MARPKKPGFLKRTFNAIISAPRKAVEAFHHRPLVVPEPPHLAPYTGDWEYTSYHAPSKADKVAAVLDQFNWFHHPVRNTIITASIGYIAYLGYSHYTNTRQIKSAMSIRMDVYTHYANRGFDITALKKIPSEIAELNNINTKKAYYRWLVAKPVLHFCSKDIFYDLCDYVLQPIQNAPPELIDMGWESWCEVRLEDLPQANTLLDVRSISVGSAEVDERLHRSCDNKSHPEEDVEEQYKEIPDGFDERGRKTYTIKKMKQVYTKNYDITNVAVLELPRLTCASTWHLTGSYVFIKYTGQREKPTVAIKTQTIIELRSKLSIKKTREENYATLIGWKNNQALQIDPAIVEDTLYWTLVFFYRQYTQELDSGDFTAPLKQ